MKKNKLLFVVDGSNFYNYLRQVLPRKYKPSLLQYSKFVRSLVSRKTNLIKNYYIGAIREEKGNLESRRLMSQQQKFLNQMRRKHGFNVRLGYILKTDNYHEKGVDVKIATDILVGAYEDLFQKVYLVSSDTDLIPAIEKTISLGKEVVYVGFADRPSFAMIKTASSAILLSKSDLEKFF